MSRRTLLLLFVAVAGLVAWLWLRPSRTSYANFPPTANGPWIAFGDSLTEGYGASAGHDYPNLLGQRLGVKIMNLGVSGQTTAEAMGRLSDAVSLNPRVVLLCLGGNDALQQTPPTQTFANLAAMIDQFQQHGAFVVLIGIRSASVRDRNEKPFARLAREKRVLHVPNILRGIFAKPVYMTDPIHPNDEGYQRIAERLEKVLRPLISQLRAGETGSKGPQTVAARLNRPRPGCRSTRRARCDASRQMRSSSPGPDIEAGGGCCVKQSEEGLGGSFHPVSRNVSARQL